MARHNQRSLALALGLLLTAAVLATCAGSARAHLDEDEDADLMGPLRVTIFSTLKPSKDAAINTSQRNAVESWTHLVPRPDIILFGDEEGTAEIARDYGALHVKEIKRSQYNTPLADDLFAQAERLAKTDIFVYSNGDIIFLRDFTEAIERARTRFPKQFLLLGRRYNIRQRERIDFANPQWQTHMQEKVQRQGSKYIEWAMDYFVFTRGLWPKIPPFAIGRPAYDNWLPSQVIAWGGDVIDATDAVYVIHQDHDYSHLPEGAKHHMATAEKEYNYELGKHKLNKDGTLTLEDRYNWSFGSTERAPWRMVAECRDPATSNDDCFQRRH